MRIISYTVDYIAEYAYMHAVTSDGVPFDIRIAWTPEDGPYKATWWTAEPDERFDPAFYDYDLLNTLGLLPGINHDFDSTDECLADLAANLTLATARLNRGLHAEF